MPVVDMVDMMDMMVERIRAIPRLQYSGAVYHFDISWKPECQWRLVAFGAPPCQPLATLKTTDGETLDCEDCVKVEVMESPFQR